MEKLNISIQCDLWHYLQSQDKPVVMYGMGNGADKILKICKKYGIETADFFASDSFVRGHFFHNKPVLSYSQICQKYGKGNFIVLLSFASSLNDVIENIKYIANETELYAPDVPVFGEEIFDLEYYNANRELFAQAYSLLADSESKKIYRNIILYKLTGELEYLFDSESDKGKVFSEILNTARYKNYADLGAYNGDSIRELLEYTTALCNVIAFEPDRRSYKKLTEYAKIEHRCRIFPYQAAAWSQKDILGFSDSGSRSSFVGSAVDSKIQTMGDSLDNVAASLKIPGIDYIKYDVEGAEPAALAGSKNCINQFRPDLLVSLYHRSSDMFELPLLIEQIADNFKYKMYLRRFRYIPAWDLNLYCIVESK